MTGVSDRARARRRAVDAALDVVALADHLGTEALDELAGALLNATDRARASITSTPGLAPTNHEGAT